MESISWNKWKCFLPLRSILGMKYHNFNYILIFFVLSLFPYIFMPYGVAFASDSDDKKIEIKQIETDLSREKAQFLKFEPI